MIKENIIWESRLDQLKRAMEYNDFETSYYIVFSDFPSLDHMKMVLSKVVNVNENVDLIVDRIHLYK